MKPPREGGGGHSAYLYTVNPLLVDYIRILKVLCLILINKGLIFTLLHGAFILYCGWNKFHTEVCFLKYIFRKKLFPPKFTDYCIKVFFNKIFIPKQIITTISEQIITTVPKKKVRICLPFWGKYSFKTRSKLKEFVNSYFPQCKSQVIFNSNNRLRIK